MDLRDVAKRITFSIASCILLLLLYIYIPVVSANLQDETIVYAHLVTATSVQGTPTPSPTPTENPTVTAAKNDLVVQQDIAARNQNDPSITTRLWNFVPALGTIVAALLAALLALFGVLRTVTFNAQKDRQDRQDARKKQAEERFKSVVEGLGKSLETKLASTVLLRTFLNPDYKEFYLQVFDLAVASLRRPEHTEESTSQSSRNIAESPDPLTQARITVFMEAFPLAREELKKQKSRFNPQFLNATEIHLEYAFLFGADLREAWMPGAFLANANLKVASLNGINLQKACLMDANLEQVILSEEAGLLANLDGADLTRASLERAILTGATLRGANLTKALLNGADLSGADLKPLEDGEPRPAILSNARFVEANLTKALLNGADLSGAVLSGTNLSYANLSGANLSGADLSEVSLSGASLSGADLSRANLGDALSLKEADLRGVIGLTKEQLKAFKEKGAIIDEDTTTSPP